MKILFKYIFTNIREKKTRTAVMLLSIVLSASLLLVSFSIGASYESAQRKMARGMAGSATLSITAAEGRIDAGVLPELPQIHTSAGILKESALYHENGYYETIDLVACDLSQLARINPPRLANGEEITDFSGYQVILPDRFASKYGIQQGDTVILQVGGEPVSLEVAGIAAYDTVFLRHTRGATVLIPLSTLFELSGETEGYTEILVEPAKGTTTAALKETLTSALPAYAYHVAEVVNEAQIASDARQKSMPFFLISFFSLTMSVFIIYSSYKVITLDRLPAIGTFRSVGATQKAVTRILLSESMLYGILGSLLGLPAGSWALKLILRGMGQSLSQGIEIPIILSPLGVALSVTVAVSVSLLSAWLPVRRASRLPVKDVVLGHVEERSVPRPIIIGAGAMLFGLSIALPKLASGKALYPAGGLSLLGLIAATLFIVPSLTNLTSKGLERLYGALLGNEGRLAARNMRDNKNTAQNITLLFISISAVIAITVVGNFVTTYITDVFQGAELQGFADGHMEPDFVKRVQEIDGIETVLPLHVYKNQMQANGKTLSRLEATDNLAAYCSMLALNFTERNMKEEAIAAFSNERALLLSEDCMKRMQFSVGDTLALTCGGGQYAYRIVGSFKSRATDVEAVIAASYAVSDFGASAYDFLAYTAADADAVMVQIRALFGDTSNWSRTVAEFNADALSTVGAFLQPMHSMTYFILLLAAVGVVNNLLIQYLQRRRSIAMYKSVGLSDRQNIKISLIEGFSSGLIGAVLAIFVSYMEIQTIFLVAGPKVSMVPKLDGAVFLKAGVMGVFVTLLGSMVPIMKSRRMKLAEEIKFE